jgi:hypothetical protein
MDPEIELELEDPQGFPVSLQEWSSYISKLEGSALLEQALGANTVQFMNSMKEEGNEPEHFKQIIIMFAKRFYVLRQAPPSQDSSQYISYPDLLSSLGLEILPY